MISKKAKNVLGALSVAVLTAPVILSGSASASGAVSNAQGGVDTVNGGVGAATDLLPMISLIINAIIGIVGIVAVIMVIIGGVNYTTSQGDPSKATKAKNTIMYGIIGLIIVLLSFAIVNFVLGALTN